MFKIMVESPSEVVRRFLYTRNYGHDMPFSMENVTKDISIPGPSRMVKINGNISKVSPFREGLTN